MDALTLENYKSHIDALNLEARQLWHEDVTKAKALAEETQRLSTSGLSEFQTYEKGWMDSLVLQAQCGLKGGLYEQAIVQVTKALEFYQRNHYFDVWQLNAYFTMGAAYATFGNLSTSLEWYQRLVKQAEVLEDKAFLALGLRNIGSLYAHQGDFSTAVYFYDLAVPHFEQSGLRRGLASMYGNYCWVYRQMGSIDLAIEYGTRCLNLFEEIADRDGQSLTHILLGNLRLQQGNFEQSASHLQTGLEIAHDLGLASYIADGYLNIGRLYECQKDFETAIATTQHALARAEAIQYKNIQMNCHELLYQCYKQTEQWKLAFDHHEQYSLLKDEIRTQESASKLRNLEVLEKTRQAQNEAEAQRNLREEDRRYYRQLNQMKDEILNTASHDLKSPLVGMKLTISSLKRHGRMDDERGQQMMGDLDQIIKQMGSLITNVLDLAKLETGRALLLERRNFAHLVEPLMKEMEPVARQKEITLEVKSSVSDVLLAFDPRRTSQVLHNLLSNAVKFTDEGGQITLAYRVDATHLIVTIADTGIGIPPHAVPHVFERFYRVPDEQHQNIDGTGLGLAIVKAIIEQHDGKVWVESEVGQGSRFSFSLPLISEETP